MKMIHLSDLHLGKRVNGFSMIEDQKYILNQILDVACSEQPDAVLIAGDIYDKSVPSAEAVELFDDFLVRLSLMGQETFVISGNHDSPERLAFGGRIMDRSGIHLSPVYTGNVTPFSMEDEYGMVNIYMLPFVRPLSVKRYFPDEDIASYTDAVKCAVDKMHIENSFRNILITHQFVTGAVRSESEEISVGGADNIDASVFDEFDYVALGHIHGPQNIGNERIRYCGSPLKYSFSEAGHIKSVTIAELKEKGDLSVRTVPLKPVREMHEIKGRYEDITLKSFYKGTDFQDSYIHITLTDEDDILNAVSRLRVIYPNLMKLDYDNERVRHHAEIYEMEDIDQKTPLQLFEEFYDMQNGVVMTKAQTLLAGKMIEKIWEDDA